MNNDLIAFARFLQIPGLLQKLGTDNLVEVARRWTSSDTARYTALENPAEAGL